MAKTPESLYGCRNNRVVSPISFAQSLIGYVIYFVILAAVKKIYEKINIRVQLYI